MKKTFFILLLSLIYFPFFVYAETISNIEIVPELDISLFSPYKIKADISGSPSSVSVEIMGLNGDGVNDWDYYADGSPASTSRTKTMTYDVGEAKYISSNIYPDDIYPEIFFANSAVTWGNAPSNIDLRRNSYHLLYFNNPFTMTSEASFFIEVNAVPRSTVNSSNLDVYLVAKDKDITFFNSDWRNSADVELMGSFDKNSVFHHTHSVNSGHHLIPLSANIDGTLGTKNLDINDNFWIVLYSQSPNSNRGWDLRYQSSSLCNNNDGWYVGNQSGWGTATLDGCPDSHIHLARRDISIADGVTATITANYPTGDPVVSTQDFSFLVLPNLAPNPTSFVSPVAGGVYDGGVGEVKNLNISWNGATDSNNDDLTYSIFLLDELGDEILPAIVEDTADTSFVYNITEIENGSYGLKGIVCDEEPLCTEFYLSSNFVVEKVDPVYSLSNITISSNNTNPVLAKEGDTISLSFTISDMGDISSTLSVEFYSGGLLVTDTSLKNKIEDVWTASYVVSADDIDGIVDFIISADNLDFEYSSTDDDSYVLVDVTFPGSVNANMESGAYNGTQDVVLNSVGSSQIRYTIDGSQPSCSLGLVYDSEINIFETITIKAIGCDLAGNFSPIVSFVYDIRKSSSSGSRHFNFDKKQIKFSTEYNTQDKEITCPGIILSRNLKFSSPLMKGGDIKLLQNYLNVCKYASPFLILDGIYGSKTKQAVIKFQLANVLVGDGIVGPLTRAKLE